MTAAEQMDWISLEDNRAAARRLLKASVERIGLAQVAHLLGQAPSTISNQLSGLYANKQPSADLAQLCFLLDETYRQHLAGLLGETLNRPPDLSPEEALRNATVRANAQGYISGKDMADLLARTRMPAAEPVLKAVRP